MKKSEIKTQRWYFVSFPSNDIHKGHLMGSVSTLQNSILERMRICELVKPN